MKRISADQMRALVAESQDQIERRNPSRVLLVPASNPVSADGKTRDMTGCTLAPLFPYSPDAAKPATRDGDPLASICDDGKARVMVAAVWESDEAWENEAAAYMAKLTNQYGEPNGESDNVGKEQQSPPKFQRS